MPTINRQLIDDEDFVARYFANRLSESEREDFEAYYLEHPEVLRELNRTAQFKAGLMDLRDSGELARLIQRPLSHTKRIPNFAIAASLLLIVIGATLVNRYDTPQLAAASAPELTGFFRKTLTVEKTIAILRTRSVSYDATIELPNQPAAIELRIKPDTLSKSGSYVLSVSSAAPDGSTTPVAQVNNLHAKSDGYVNAYLNTQLLSPGVYSVWISDALSTEKLVPEQAFEIEIVQP